MGLFDWLFGKKPEPPPKTETPNDRVAALVEPALARANRAIENLRDRGWVLDFGTRTMLTSALEDLTKAAAIEKASAEWKWKIFFNIGVGKLRLLDFQGTVDALTRALHIADVSGKAYLQSSGFWELSLTINRGVDDRDSARLYLARGKAGIGDRAGAKADLLELLKKDSLAASLRQ